VTVAERFGDNLRRCRKQAGLSQEEVARRASMHRTQVAVAERGERLPRIDTLVKLAGALEVSPDELLAGLKWKPGEVQAGRFEEG
jgi:transcriptional regulator with XRE-family HTH domain